MSFLFPLTLFLGLLAPVIALLYLHRPRRRTAVVSSLRFWRAVLEREPHRRFLGRLRNPLSLLLQLLIFLLLLLALARPEWGQLLRGQNTVIVLDARARMQAGDTFSLARKAAGGLTARAGPDHEVAVLANDGSPRILSPFSSDRRGLRESLTTIAPSDAGGGMRETLTLARRLIAGRPGPGRIVVLTDRPLPPDENTPPVETLLVGTPHDNLGLVAFAHRPLPASPQSEEVFATLANYSAQEQTAEVEVALDDRVFDLKKFSLAAGTEKDFTTLLPREMLAGSETGKLTFRLLGSDALATDNLARAVLTPDPIRVLLLSTGNPFLENALKADPTLEVEILEPTAWQPKMADGFQVVVFDNWVPEGATNTDDFRGNFFFFGRSPWEATDGEPAPAAITVADPQSPLLWQMDGWSFPPGPIRTLHPPEGWRVNVPLETAKGPAVMTLERPGSLRMVATGFGVRSSVFPLRVGFPIFVNNTIHWLAGRTRENSTSRVAGRMFVPAPGDRISTRPRQADAPSPSPSDFSGTPQRLTGNGFYEILSPDAAAPHWIAVNTLDRQESDLREATTDGNSFLLRHTNPAYRPWQWLALAAFLLMVLEWVLHHRRLTE